MQQNAAVAEGLCGRLQTGTREFEKSGILPRGSKILALFSGGIDSPVALSMLSRCFRPLPIHFVASRFHDASYHEIMKDVFSKIFPVLGIKKLFLAPFSHVLEKIREDVKRKYRCIICRRCMLLASFSICREYGLGAIATAEVLAQKASQTLFSMACTHYAIPVPVLHPLLCMDKEEIVKVARERGIYMERHLGSCQLAPRFPATKVSPSKIIKIFKKSRLSDELEICVKNAILTDDFEKIEVIEQ